MDIHHHLIKTKLFVDGWSLGHADEARTTKFANSIEIMPAERNAKEANTK